MEEIVHIEVTRSAKPSAKIPTDSLEALLWSYGNSVYRAHLIGLFPEDQSSASWEVSLILVASTFPDELADFSSQTKKLVVQGQDKHEVIEDFIKQIRNIFGADSKIGIIAAER